MPFWRTYYHIVWATSNREPFLSPQVEARLFPYLLNKATQLGVYVYALNGWTDHVHMVISIPPRLAIAEVAKRLKGASSRYLNESCGFDGSFAWQRGYGVLSLGERQRKDAEAYVLNQKAHHQDGSDNPWLEHVTPEDEGPSHMGIQPYSESRAAKEEAGVYDAMGEPPF